MPFPEVPRITAGFGAILDGAADLRRQAGNVDSFADAAGTRWRAIGAHYQEPSTELKVLHALNLMAAPSDGFRDAFGAAAAALENFAAEAGPLKRVLDDLRERVARFDIEYPPPDPGEDGEAPDRSSVVRAGAQQQLAEEIRQAARRWRDIRQDCVQALTAISGGTGAGLPRPGIASAAALPAVTPWAQFDRHFDDAVHAAAESLAVRLAGLPPGELQDWATAHPDAVALLQGNRMPPHPPGSPEAALDAALAAGRGGKETGIRGIRDAFLALPVEQQTKFVLLYPALLGGANGIPFAYRVLANRINIVAEQQKRQTSLDRLTEQLSATEAPEPNPWLGRAAGDVYLQQLQEYEELKDAVAEERAAVDGYQWAIDNHRQVVLVSDEGDGRYVEMRGQMSAGTTSVFTLVPGTGASLATNQEYGDRLDILYDGSRDTVGFYWMGADLPDTIPDNVTDGYSRRGAAGLSAFGHAAELERPAAAVTTTISYSAGASLHGAAEQAGYATDNVVYLAPAGPGPDIHSAEDTGNAEANRYWIQTRDDPIAWAQLLGHWTHGGSPAQLDAVRLESGFAVSSDPSSGLLGGHTDYFMEQSTAVANMRAVINGTDAVAYVEDELAVAGRGVVSYSPLEADPAGFDNWKTVPTR
ncbi:hypothetical protein [Arthrobacter mangrovi]|uniref:Alpha/beta hydrolase n=1 Tax=Arthrobacter mangrovi TaxID=2966350 RepID=A0ABQ5MZC6_9MICC|nr:hypothetical protein [Arthrobacter mangrovi]GLB69322.1 hypothetical protein AHIS1636_37650 [Arthrobacter mangrovi]